LSSNSFHIGFKRYVIYDDDAVEESNLNRLVGARWVDVAAATPKLHLAKMMIYGLQPGASVKGLGVQVAGGPRATPGMPDCVWLRG
jgi:molybdopterin/thiamine biosynthesis adenylyltransferase